MRLAILFAISTAHGACSPAGPSADSMAASKSNMVAVSPEDSRPEQSADPAGGSTVTEAQILISSDQGRVTAELVDNEAAKALVRLLPITIQMRDHLRQEKTGNLPSALPQSARQTEFSAGMLGLWGTDDFVVYYRNGSVPQPGIIVLGRVLGDLSIFDGPEPVTVRIEQAD